MPKATPRKLKKVFLGQAKLGQIWFCVYLDPSRADAEFTTRWEPNKANSMTIGADKRDYCDCRELLMHEAVEAALTAKSGAYSLFNGNKYAAYIQFNFSHEQYQYAIEEANLFMMYIEPKLKAAFETMYPDKPYIKGLELK